MPSTCSSARTRTSRSSPAHARPQQFEEQARTRWGALADQYLALYPHATDEEAQASASADVERRHVLAHAALRRLSSAARQQSVSLLLRAEPAGARPGSRRSRRRTRPRSRTCSTTSASCRCSRTAATRSSPARRRPIGRSRIRCRRIGRTSRARGNPNGAGLPVWQEHQVGASDRAIILDADPSSERLPTKPRLELYDKLYAQMRAAR